MDIKEQLTASAEQVEHFLGAILTTDDKDLLSLYASMRYSALAGGKRIRPYLTLTTAKMFGGNVKEAIYFAAAIEMVHTYSLIHDDLPSMDDDDMRRGKPTNHKVYGEATATLAGDALLTNAFEILCAAPLSAELRIEAVRLLSEAAGAEGMVGGQIMDLAAEETAPPLETVIKTHSLKTGAMIRASVLLGLLAAGVTDPEIHRAMGAYAHYIGLAFQIVDDLLDVVGDEKALGKPIGSDAEEGKTTFMSFFTPEEAKAYAERLTESAKEAIAPYEGSEPLALLADYLLARQS